jgi:hypothetical protein
VQRESALYCELFDGATRRSHAAARGPVGLRQDERYLMAGISKTCKRNRGEFGCAGEY